MVVQKLCKKIVVENFFEPCILSLLISGPNYGYALREELISQCGCEVDIGNLYRHLGKMKKLGIVQNRVVKSEQGPDKKLYEITAVGKKLLKSWIDELEGEMKVIKKLINNYKRNYETGNK